MSIIISANSPSNPTANICWNVILKPYKIIANRNIFFEEKAIPLRKLSGINLFKILPISIPMMIARVNEFKFIDVHNSHLQVK